MRLTTKAEKLRQYRQWCRQCVSRRPSHGLRYGPSPLVQTLLTVLTQLSPARPGLALPERGRHSLKPIAQAVDGDAGAGVRPRKRQGKWMGIRATRRA